MFLYTPANKEDATQDREYKPILFANGSKLL